MTLAVAMKRRNSKREGRMELHVNRGCHVNNLIRLASLRDSPHKIFQPVLCQTVYFAERFWNELLLIAPDLPAYWWPKRWESWLTCSSKWGLRKHHIGCQNGIMEDPKRV